MNSPLYTTEILRLAASLPQPAKLERVDARSSQRSPTCGSTVEVEVQIDSSGRIQALSQKVHACAFGQASAAIAAQQAPGRSADQIRSALEQLSGWLAGEGVNPPDWPGFGALAPARARRSRHGAILLPLRAIEDAMNRRAA